MQGLYELKHRDEVREEDFSIGELYLVAYLLLDTILLADLLGIIPAEEF